MASTYKPSRALLKAESFLHHKPVTDEAAAILDHINKIIWMAAPWRWTLGSLPVVTLLADDQDFDIALPSDFLFVQSAELTDTDDLQKPLVIEPVVAPTHGCSGIPARIAVTGTPGSTGQMDIYPKWGSTIPSPAPRIISLYKKTAPSVTQANMDTAGTLVMDDEWFWVYETGVMWQAFKFGNDLRAGSVTADNQSVKYTGEYAAFIAALRWMAGREKLSINEMPTPAATWSIGG